MRLQFTHASVGPKPEGRAASVSSSKEHWFTFGESCVFVLERAPSEETGHVHEPVLFFLHGRFGHGGIWTPLVKSLASHFRCLHVDLPGFGRSFSVRDRGFSLLEQAQIIKTVVRRFLTIGKKAVLVGHDTGGAIAQLCAIHEPESLAGLVLINSASLTLKSSDFRTGPLGLHARRRLKRLLKHVSFRIDSEALSALAGPWASRSGRESLIQAFQTWEYTWPGVYERQIWRDEICKLRHPVLLLWGNRDPLNPPDTAEELMRYLPDAYLFEHDECGHWPCLEETEWVDTKMREFLFRLGA